MVQFIFEGSRTKFIFWSKFAYALVRIGVPDMKNACSVTPSWKKYLHHHFFLKSQHAPLKQKIIAQLKKKRFCGLSHHLKKFFTPIQNFFLHQYKFFF